jgi:ubiquinone biosynthesis monooxygenase Coq7
MTINSHNLAPSFRHRPGLFDVLIGEIDVALNVLSGHAHAGRPYPAASCDAHTDQTLTDSEKQHAAALMRVNHVGEVCAQALYRGQALGCKSKTTIAVLREAAVEETDHLAWCGHRLQELKSRPSYLNPVWYAGSFAMGLAASRLGNARNLGFMAETEQQVEAHLDSHLIDLPAQDQRSRAIVLQMREDEIKHRKTAQNHGGVPLAKPIKMFMTFISKVMTKTAYRI